jgi:undecaprenyl phosphate-alpha-L-ara4N flippase subunit ArnE
MTPLWTILVVIFATIIGAIGALYFKKASKKLEFNIIKLLKLTELYIAVFLYVLSSVFFIFALKFGELSVLYPVTSASYIWITLLSIKYLKEKMNIWKWIGIIAVIIGVVLIGIAS